MADATTLGEVVEKGNELLEAVADAKGTLPGLSAQAAAPFVQQAQDAAQMALAQGSYPTVNTEAEGIAATASTANKFFKIFKNGSAGLKRTTIFENVSGVSVRRDDLVASEEVDAKAEKSVVDVKVDSRTSTLRNLPLIAGRDEQGGTLVDGQWALWLDSFNGFHSNHSHAGLAELPSTISRTVQTRYLPMIAGRDEQSGVLIDGAWAHWTDSNSVFHSNHTHPEFAILSAAIAAANQRIDVIEGSVGNAQISDVYTVVDAEGHSQIMAYTGSNQPAAQITQPGYDWISPKIVHGNVVKCLTDWFFVGRLLEVLILPGGEIIGGLNFCLAMMGYGQSLSLGSRGFFFDPVTGAIDTSRAFTTTPSIYTNYALTLQSGPRMGNVATAVQPTREFVNDVLGETPYSTYANQTVESYLTRTGQHVRVFGSIHGVGGQPYSALKKGTAAYNVMLTRLGTAHNFIAAQGWDDLYEFWLWVHGESYSGSPTIDAVLADLNEIEADVGADLKAITGQRRKPWMLMTQMNRPASNGGNRNVPLAQVKAHDTHPNICVVGPKYQNWYYDEAHGLCDTYISSGVLVQRAMRFNRRPGCKWQSLKVVSTSFSGNKAIFRFNNRVAGDLMNYGGPVGPLRWHPYRVAPIANRGFASLNPGNPITSVALGASGNTVEVTFALPLTAGLQVAYAMQTELNLPAGQMPSGRNPGSRGELCDTDERDINPFWLDYEPNFLLADVFTL